MPDDQFSGLPASVAKRAREFHSLGMTQTEALGRALHDLQSDDWSLEDIAEVWGAEPETLATYKSKADDRIEDSLKQVILSYGGAATILAEYTPHRPRHNKEQYFIVSGFWSEKEYRDAHNGDEQVCILKVTGGASGGHPSMNVSFSFGQRYKSLDDLAEDKYRTQDFGALEEPRRLYSLLTDAGVSTDSLKEPAMKLPASHPDSADHFQYQMRSVERSHGRDRGAQRDGPQR